MKRGWRRTKIFGTLKEVIDFDKIECAGWLDSSCDDGPGMRSVLFLQGCMKNCIGCQNHRIREHGRGTWFEIDALVAYIESRCCNRRITISGGEPLEQLSGLIVLLEELRKRNYEICVYTGWELKMVPKEVLALTDYIKTGGFVKELRNASMHYVGSSNQHMYLLKHGNIEELSLVG